MEHAITVADVLVVSGIAVTVLIVFAAIGYVITLFANAFND